MTHATNIESRPALAPGAYRIDPARSRVRFAIKEGFGLMTARGTFTIRDGTVSVSAEPAASSATATLDVASFKTDKPRRDSTVVSKRFLNAAAHPTMRFASTRLACVDGTWTLTGLLTACGVVSEVSLHLVNGAATVNGCRFTATARIDRHAFGVTAARGMIARWLDVEFDVYAVAASSDHPVGSLFPMTVFWINHGYDRERAADGPSRYAAHVRSNADSFGDIAFRNEYDGGLGCRITLVAPWPAELTANRVWGQAQGWRDWPVVLAQYVQPPPRDLARAPHLRATLLVEAPLPLDGLPPAPDGPHTEITAAAARTVAVVVRELNALLDPVVRQLEPA